jgi:hypothetical protein
VEELKEDEEEKAREKKKSRWTALLRLRRAHREEPVSPTEEVGYRRVFGTPSGH